jgi:hypothetical protein
VVDAVRAALLVGFEDREQFRDAMALVLVSRREDQTRFEAVFDSFFVADGAHARDLFGRLARAGLDPEALRRLQELLAGIAASGEDSSARAARLLLGIAEVSAVDRGLSSAEVERALRGLTSRLQVGYFAQRVLEVSGLGGAGRELGKLQSLIEGEFGADLGRQLVEALRRELSLLQGEVRAFVEQAVRQAPEAEEARARGGAKEVPFGALSREEIEEVRRATRQLGERLRGAARVRARRARRGRVDARQTMREAMRTGGVPVRLRFRRPRRDKPRLWVLCDVSDSVRLASVFLLEFVAMTQELFDRTRTFVFVSDLGETTDLFARRPLEEALAEVFSGAVVATTRNSNYGRALQQFEARHGREIDRRCTLVILGDGRSNHQPPEVEVIERLRERARSILWLCPEPEGSWGTGDSMMPRYARAVTRVLRASTASELEEAARRLLRA